MRSKHRAPPSTRKTQSWADVVDTGVMDTVVRESRTLDEAAARLGVTGPALRRAWSRFRVQDLSTELGADTVVFAEDLAGMTTRAANPRIKSEYRTQILKPESGEIWVIPGDIHGGIQDDKSLELALDCAEHMDARIILQGDTWDCYGISRHNKTADRIRRGNWALADERDVMLPYLERIAAIGKSSGLQPWILMGNHEARIQALVDEQPALDGCLNIRHVFSIPDSIQVADPGIRIRAGSLVVEHGHQVNGSLSRHGADAVLARQPDQTTIYGHSHKIIQARRTTYDERGRARTRMACSVGHLSKSECHTQYAGTRPDWQQGFAVVEFFQGSGRKTRFQVDLVEVHDHEFSYRGDVYR